MFARIYQPANNAMQSGTKGSAQWHIAFAKGSRPMVDPLTGMAGSDDPLRQLDLTFDSKEAAIAYAKARGIPFRVTERPKHKPVGRSYADNFAFDRRFPWTH